jgi:hypothetical protein
MRSVFWSTVAIAGCSVLLQAQVDVVASGLNNPRGLAFAPNGALYVAEAGCGGPAPCEIGGDGEHRCYGPTGSITAIDLRKGTQTRVVTELPSLAGEGGNGASGVHDISFQGLGNAYFTIGYGGDPANRAALGGVGGYFAHVARMTPNGDWKLVSDPGSYEGAVDPLGDGPDTNPYGLLALPGKQVVADAGGNDLLEIAANGNISTLAVFPNRTVPGPAPGSEVSMDAVPTSVAVGPDGYYYVGQLTGFPFPVGGANVYRVPPGGGTPEVYATGFSSIIDLTFGPDGSLYVLQISTNMLAGFNGALYRVAPDGTRTELAAGQLFAPGGVQLGRDGAVYVTNKSILCGGGEVLRITQ